MGDLTRRDIEFAIRLLQAALRYIPEREIEDVELPVDTPDEDVVRWEGEGGSPSREPVV